MKKASITGQIFLPKKATVLAVSIALGALLSGCGATDSAQSNASNSVNAVKSEITTTTAQSGAHLHKLLEEIWDFELSISPSFAKSYGKEPTRALSDISPEALAKNAATFEGYLAALDKIDPSTLSNSDSISLLMQKYRLQNYVDQYKFKEYLVPITSEFGFHSAIGNRASGASIKSQKDLQHHMMLLREIPEHFRQQIAYMREGMASGQVQPKAVLAGFEDSVETFLSQTPEESTFFTAFENMPDALKTDENIRSAKAAISAVNGAYSAFYDFLTDEYIPNAKTDIAVKTWPQGEAFYNNRIKHFTTTDMTAKEIHNIGLAEVARIRAEMQEIVNKLEFDGDINEFITFLRTDPRFYAQTPEDLIITASYISKQMDAQLPKLFKKLPRTPYGVEPVPESIAPKYTTGRYVSPRSDDQPGYYWVNTYALDKRPLYALPALTLHEAVPGHHLQISLAAEMEELPNVRRSTYISAFGEGWGLYSEYLGVEVGIYEDPYDDFGRLSYEMWRACRLVVDTGMHLFGWSRDKAVYYMLENTALSEHNVNTEIDRYISWPGQALSYKIGEIKIKELRARAESALGENFDVRDFHDAVLANGSVPLFVLEQHIDAFIDTQLKQQPQG
jgi:uncharacterized protein (DUF885 family)